MNLIGEYTQAGAALSALILAGGHQLNITRCAAGSGRTPASAQGLEEERQALMLLGHTLNGDTLTVPAKLLSVEAAEAYLLGEIGLYASGQDGREILYKIYRFDYPINVSPECSLTATFFLNETVVPGTPAKVAISPAGLLTEADGIRLLEGIAMLDESDAVEISCHGDSLQRTLDSLPRIIGGPVKITVTGPVDGDVVVRDFAGPGSLTITGSAQHAINGWVRLVNCRVAWLLFDNFALAGTTLYPCNVRDYDGAALSVVDCGSTRIERVTVHAPETVAGIGFFVQHSNCVFAAVDAQKRRHTILGHMFAQVVIRSMNGQGAQGSTYLVCVDNGSTAVVPYPPTSMSSSFGTSSTQLVAASRIFYDTYLRVPNGQRNENE